MADKTVEVTLSDYVADLDSTALKELAPAPIARRLQDMVDLLHAKARRLKEVTPSELACALIHTTSKSDADELAGRVERYREAQVWETLETRRRTGKHAFTLPGPGRRKRSAS